MTLPSDFGVLTLCIPKDYKKAIALSITLKEHDPDVKTAVVCSEKLKPLVENYFNHTIIEHSHMKGFEHKLYLDQYSPFEKTFFFDADILIIKSIKDTVKLWQDSGYAVRGKLTKDGISSFGLNRQHALKILNKSDFSQICGAGHAYFEKPYASLLFDEARAIVSEYEKFEVTGALADEDVIGIAMTKLDLAPKDNDNFLGSPWCAIKSTFKIDTNTSTCQYKDIIEGNVEPVIVHFPRFAYPLTYARELSKTYKRAGIKIDGIWYQAIKEFYIGEFLWPLKAKVKSLLGLKN
jgi:hypothetical protein